MSLSSGGAQGDFHSYSAAISADGRFVFFDSTAANFVVPDTNGLEIFVRDRLLGTTERVSVDPSGAQADGSCWLGSISEDGRYVVFASYAPNLVPGDTNAETDIFVRDHQTGVTECVSIGWDETQANDSCGACSISADGRYVVFQSRATNLVPWDSNGFEDIFVRDRQHGWNELISVDSSANQGNDHSTLPSISADGRFVAFRSHARNLVPGDMGYIDDIFVRDRESGTTERVSVDSLGVQANGECVYSSISADGRYVTFDSVASNLVSGDTNSRRDVFVRDRQLGVTERVSVNPNGTQGNWDSSNSSISADGRYVLFNSAATDLVPGDGNGQVDVFVRDLQLGVTERVSVSSGGAQGNRQSYGSWISADGRRVTFMSDASTLVPGDTNGFYDVFVRERYGRPDFTSLCDPGTAEVIVCPCANPPSAPGRGCDNSAGTGGAVLSAEGGTYLSSDSLVFTTSGEKPTATSIVLQGSALIPAGTVYGQGVRCAGESLERLYTKAAVGGSITAPEFGAGDPSVSARSATLGNAILPGQSRWYLVYYRDPIVLGGCPATSTFNSTQTGEVVWSP